MVKRLNSEIGLHQLNLKKLLTKNGLLIPDISQAEKKSLFALVRILVVRINSNFLNVQFRFVTFLTQCYRFKLNLKNICCEVAEYLSEAKQVLLAACIFHIRQEYFKKINKI